MANLFTNLDDLSLCFEKYQTKSCFIVCRPTSYQSSGAKTIVETILKERNIAFTYFCDFDLNPKYEDILIGMKVFQNSNCDTVFALGGGSALDIAKIIAIMSEPANDFLNHLETASALEPNTTPIIAVPTTAGTGSEATRYGIMYYKKTKYTIAHPSIRPWSVILDGSLMLSLPNYFLALTAMDALSQAIESYWSVKATDESKAYAKEAIPIILDNIHAGMKKDFNALNLLLKGSNLAGEAIEITGTTAPHAMSYGLTTYYDIPHGHGVGLLLPEVYKRNADPKFDVCHPRGKGYLAQTMQELNTLLRACCTKSALLKLYHLLQSLGLLKKIKNLDIEMLVDKVPLDRLGNNPAVFTRDTLCEIYESIKDA